MYWFAGANIKCECAECSLCVQYSQPFTMFARLRGDVKRYPAVWFFKSHQAYILKIAETCAGAETESRRCVRVVEREAQMKTDFLER